MSQSGSTNLPPQIQRGAQTPQPAQDGVKAKVLSVPAALSDLNAPTRLEGEVIHKSEDGKTRIRTERGEIRIELRQKRLDALQKGDRVEIELPRGRPPQSADIKPAQDARQNNASTEAPPPSSTTIKDIPDTIELAAQAKSLQQNSTPSSTETAARLADIPADVPQQRPLTETATVRLTPLSSTQEILPKSQLQNAQPSEAHRLIKLEQAINPLTSILPALQTQIEGIAKEALINLPLPALLSPSHSSATPPPLQTAYSKDSPAPVISQLLTTPKTQNALTFTKPSGKEKIALSLPATQKMSLLTVSHSGRAADAQSMLSKITDKHLDTMNHRFASRPLDGVIKQINQTGIIFKSISGKAALAHDGLIKNAPSGKVETAALKNISAKDIRLSDNSAGSLQARVSGFTEKNQPVLSLIFPGERIERQFVMQFQTNNIEANSRITITPLSTGAAATAAAAASNTAQTTMPVFSAMQFMNSPEWQTLDESLKTLMLSQNSSQALSSMTNTLPSPAKPSQLAPTVMFFLAAVQMGDVKSWFGERILDTLRQLGKGDLANRMSSELSGIQRMSTDSAGQEWRTLPLPMVWQDEVHKIAMHYKEPDQDGENEDSRQKGTRFIFDLSLPRMGNVQLDGYAKSKQIDLVLRTEKPLSTAMQQDMRKKYAAGLDVTGMSGELGFRSKILEIKAAAPQETTTFSI